MNRHIERRSWVAPSVIAGLIVIASAGLVAARGESPAVAEPALSPMPVDAAAIQFQQSYTLSQAFSGQVEARRVSTLGFESSGRLQQVQVEEGDEIEAGDLVAQLDTARLLAKRDELVAAQAEAEARLALASATLQRFRDIVEQGGVSRQGLDEARESQRTARAALRLAEQRIASVEVDLDKTRLLAPFSGTVTKRLADEGRVLGNGEPIVELQERSAPEIRIGIAGRALETLQPGQTHSLEWRGQTLQAELRTVLPLRSAGARTVDALFIPLDINDIESPDPLLPGDTVTLRLDTRVEAAGAWVPMTALTSGERGLWSLYIVSPEQPEDDQAALRIERRTVDVLHQTNDRVFVRGDLQTDDVVVQSGLQRIVPGQQVLIVGPQLGSSS